MCILCAISSAVVVVTKMLAEGLSTISSFASNVKICDNLEFKQIFWSSVFTHSRYLRDFKHLSKNRKAPLLSNITPGERSLSEGQSLTTFDLKEGR